jgi:hypothetical protein
MAVVQGLVQRLKLTSGFVLAWAYIGPSPTSTTLLLVTQRTTDPIDIAARASMADALSSAFAVGRQVSATHADNSADIDMIEVVP